MHGPASRLGVPARCIEVTAPSRPIEDERQHDHQREHNRHGDRNAPDVVAPWFVEQPRHGAPDDPDRDRLGGDRCDGLGGEPLRGARLIAAPGCFATAAQLALFPFRTLLADTTPSLFGITGSSGAGAKPRDKTHHPARAHNLFAYSTLGHRHDAEILHSWRQWTGRSDATARLLVHSGPFVRGIYLTLHTFTKTPLAAGGPGRLGDRLLDLIARR